ncbi:hypothetical protein VTK73DRAFT_489 [Phialemonium thermophilum]|uniref:Uncharacterized protein n=1 Tax=Phialemonium thermophilum TaxID=223376 RepID=A0ABR3VUW4_9PEZI
MSTSPSAERPDEPRAVLPSLASSRRWGATTSRRSRRVSRPWRCFFSRRLLAWRFTSALSSAAFCFCLSPPSIQGGLVSLYRHSISRDAQATQTGRASSHFLRRRRHVQQPSELLGFSAIGGGWLLAGEDRKDEKVFSSGVAFLDSRLGTCMF